MTQQCLFGFGDAWEIHYPSYPRCASRLELPSSQEVIHSSLLVVDGLWLLYPTTPWYCLFITAPYIPTFSSILWPLSDGDFQPISPSSARHLHFSWEGECQFYRGSSLLYALTSITLVMLSTWLMCNVKKQIYLISNSIDAIIYILLTLWS